MQRLFKRTERLNLHRATITLAVMSAKNSHIVYSTHPESVQNEESEENSSVSQKALPIRMSLDRKNRAGKAVTLLEGFSETLEEIERLAKQLKSKCASGGTVKDRKIEIQGDHRKKIEAELIRLGYRVKRVGG